MGLAASASIRGAVEQRELGSTVTVGDLAVLSTAAGHSDTGKAAQLRQVFTDAFNESMVVCSGIAAVCFAITLMTYQRNPAPPAERRKANLIQEIKRRKEKQANEKDRGPQGEKPVGCSDVTIESKDMP